MQTKVIAGFLTVLVLCSGANVSAGTQNDAQFRHETEMIPEVFKKVAKQVVTLPGLANSQRVCLMCVRNSFDSEKLDRPEGGNMDTRFALIGQPLAYLFGLDMGNLGKWFRNKKEYPATLYLPMQDETLTHCPALEDLIIKELAATKKHVLIESLADYYDEHFSAQTSKRDRMSVLHGIDTVLICTVNSFRTRDYKRHTFFVNHHFSEAEIELTCRTIDAATDAITSSDTFSAKDTVKKARWLSPKPYEFFSVLASLATFGVHEVGDF